MMLPTEKNLDAMADRKEHCGRHCALRMVGRAGYLLAGSHRRNASHSVAQHCSSTTPFRHRRIIRKPAVHKIRSKSTAQENGHVDDFMDWLSDHTYLSKSSHRRSSLPMDYRSLAGMTPKWYVKRQKSVINLQETADGRLGAAEFDRKFSFHPDCDLNVFLLGPLDPVSMAQCTEPVCRSSTCDCFSFCDSLSAEHGAPKSKTVVDSLVTYARYIDCSGSHKVTCDLHLVGAVESVSDRMPPALCVVKGQSALAVDGYKQGDYVDNICIDCGCQLTCDDMLECAYSVPICSVCSLVARHDVPSDDSSVMADHSYACMCTDHLACLSPLRGTASSSYAIRQQPEAPDIDVVDDITFLSFPSKLLMHRYILTQQNSCDHAVKSSWVELARCERARHTGHKSYRRAWFGSVRHRHMDRFSAHNRLNEQIELGLMRPVSAQNSAELRGIKLKLLLSQNNTNKAVVARKHKKQNMPNDLRLQRPTRIAAKGHYYCLTRKGIAVRTLLEAEHVDIMKLTRQQAEKALALLHIPSLITRNNCSQPGIFNAVFVFSSFICFLILRSRCLTMDE